MSYKILEERNTILIVSKINLEIFLKKIPLRFLSLFPCFPQWISVEEFWLCNFSFSSWNNCKSKKLILQKVIFFPLFPILGNYIFCPNLLKNRTDFYFKIVIIKSHLLPFFLSFPIWWKFGLISDNLDIQIYVNLCVIISIKPKIYINSGCFLVRKVVQNWL